MQKLANVVLGKQARRRIALNSLFVRKAHWCQRATSAASLFGGDWWAHAGIAHDPRPLNGRPDPLAHDIGELNSDARSRLVISHSTVDRSPGKCLFDKHTVRGDLHLVGVPSLWPIGTSGGTATLLLCNDQDAVSPSNSVDFSHEPERVTTQLQREPLALIEFDVEPSPCKHRRICDAYLLDLF